MKLSSRQDINAPAAFVFTALADFEAWERAAMRRGADVERTDKANRDGSGRSWLIRFTYRGKARRIAVQLTAMQPQTSMEFAGNGASLDGMAGLDLMELAPLRTRLSITLDLRPRTIGARILMQSLRLAKTRVNRRFSDRVMLICDEIESRYRKSTQK